MKLKQWQEHSRANHTQRGSVLSHQPAVVAEEEHETHEEHDGHKQKKKDMELGVTVRKLALKYTEAFL